MSQSRVGLREMSIVWGQTLTFNSPTKASNRRRHLQKIYLRKDLYSELIQLNKKTEIPTKEMEKRFDQTLHKRSYRMTNT